MKKTDRLVGYDIKSLPVLTQADHERLKALSDQPDSSIDFSDQPELNDAQLAQFKPGLLFKPRKQQITARVDADVLAWLKSDGRGYQTRLNTILRSAMEESETKANRS